MKFFLALACINKNSFLNREISSFFRMIFNRPQLPAPGNTVSVRDRITRW